MAWAGWRVHMVPVYASSWTQALPRRPQGMVTFGNVLDVKHRSRYKYILCTYIYIIYIYVLWQNMPSQFTILYKLCVAGSSTRSSPWRAVVAFLYQTESDMPRSVVAIATWPAGQCCITALAYRPWKRSLLHGWLPFKAARNGWC